MMHQWIRYCGAVVMALAVSACGPGEQSEAPEFTTLSAEEVREIAAEAYIYGFPMVMGYKTLYSYAIDEGGPEYKGPFNHVACEARLFTPDDTAVVTPNADTPYCMTWMDLRAEPLVLSVPEVEPDRYYSFQLIDLFTHNFAYVGSLSTGTDAGNFLIAGPSWEGETPPGIEQVVRSDTDFILSITRTQLYGPDDLARVAEIQEYFELVPLGAFLGTAPAEPEPLPSFPEWVEGAQFDARSFEYIDVMLRLVGEPPAGEEALWSRMQSIGLGPGAERELRPTSEVLADGVSDGMATLEQFIREAGSDPLVSAKIFGTRDFLASSARDNYGFDNAHLLRAAGAQAGLYGNSAVEALYPTYRADASGQPYDASTTSYTLTFDELPPVKSFWSLTMYDGRTQLFVRNELDRYLLSSVMLDDFVREDDGALVIHVSKASPGPDREANWLPAPDGPFYMVLRLYGPEAEALTGEWMPPPVVPVGD